jgi:hypothetical protein
MHCFYHDTIDAIAICKNCSRGLCRDCSTEFANGIACKGRCENEVNAINQIINRNKTSYKKTSAAYTRNALTYLLIAIVFGVWGAAAVGTRPMLGMPMLILGVIALVAAVLNYSTGQRFLQSEDDR